MKLPSRENNKTRKVNVTEFRNEKWMEALQGQG